MLPIAHMVKATETLPNRIREWRLRRNISMQGLAERVGTSVAQIQRMETGVRTVSFDWAERIAAAMDVTPGDLLARESNPFLPTDRERALLEKIRQGGELLLRTVEAVAMVQDKFESHDAPAGDDVAAPDQGSGGTGAA